MEEAKTTTKKYNGPKLFVGRLSPSTSPQSLRSHFEAICAVQVVKVEFSRKSKNKKGFGYVIIDRPEDVQLVLSKSHVIDGKLVDVMPYCLEATTKWYKNKAESLKIKLRNLPQETTEESISLFFERFARVLVVNILEEKLIHPQVVEKVAYVELLNSGRTLKIGRHRFSCDPAITQSVNYFSIEKEMNGSRKPYSAPLIESPKAECITDYYKACKSLLDFQKANHIDVHSKYEFIRARQNGIDNSTNYRFNIRKPNRISLAGQPLARQVALLEIPTRSSLCHQGYTA